MSCRRDTVVVRLVHDDPQIVEGELRRPHRVSGSREPTRDHDLDHVTPTLDPLPDRRPQRMLTGGGIDCSAEIPTVPPGAVIGGPEHSSVGKSSRPRSDGPPQHRLAGP